MAPNDRLVSWETFAAAVAALAQVPADEITPEAGLDQDLGLDSLALTELVVLLIVDFDMQSLADELEHRDWSKVTMGELYDEYQMGRKPRDDGGSGAIALDSIGARRRS